MMMTMMMMMMMVMMMINLLFTSGRNQPVKHPETRNKGRTNIEGKEKELNLAARRG